MKEKILNIQTECLPKKLDREELRQLEKKIKESEVTYELLLLGGFGLSRGIESLIEILDGNFKGCCFFADLGGGLQSLRSGPLNHFEIEKYKAFHKKTNAHLSMYKKSA